MANENRRACSSATVAAAGASLAASQGVVLTASGRCCTKWLRSVPSDPSSIRSLSQPASKELRANPPAVSFGNPAGAAGSVGDQGLDSPSPSSKSEATRVDSSNTTCLSRLGEARMPYCLSATQ